MCGRLEEKSPIREAWNDKVGDVVKTFETVKKMWHTFLNSVKRDMINGDAESRTQ